MRTNEELRHIQAVTAQLAKEHPGVSREVIDNEVRKAHHAFDGRRIRDFIPVFVERRVKNALRGQAAHSSR